MQDTGLRLEELTAGGNGERAIRVHGPLLLSNFFPFQTAMREDKSPALVLDLSDVPYIDSAGIGALVGVHVHRQRESRSLLLVGVTERVRTSLEITKVDLLFQFADRIPGAAAAGG